MANAYKEGSVVIERIANSDSLEALVKPKPTYVYSKGRRVTPKDVERLVDARRRAFSVRERGKADMRSISLESIIHRSSRKVNMRYN